MLDSAQVLKNFHSLMSNVHITKVLFQAVCSNILNRHVPGSGIDLECFVPEKVVLFVEVACLSGRTSNRLGSDTPRIDTIPNPRCEFSCGSSYRCESWDFQRFARRRAG
jgi:hypothetical protein